MEIRPPCRAPVLCGNSPIFMTKICQMTGSCVLIYVRRDFAYQLLRTTAAWRLQIENRPGSSC
ncbi:hypothetical protein, partial [Escherichia coli]|uniref:hypothetical protein n=1 Tax=Escherichia coli TaxID=562 RepID=UPI0039BFC28D